MPLELPRMIELAERFALTEGSHKRSIIFAAFSGEELGLLGSKYFIENPPVDLSKVNAMLNLDMVGRLRDSSSFQIGGAGTAEGLKDILRSGIDTTRVNPVNFRRGFRTIGSFIILWKEYSRAVLLNRGTPRLPYTFRYMG